MKTTAIMMKNRRPNIVIYLDTCLFFKYTLTQNSGPNGRSRFFTGMYDHDIMYYMILIYFMNIIKNVKYERC